MNPTPRLNWNGYNGPIENTSCGILAMDNHAVTFWQSRETVAGHRANPPRLTDIPALAQAVRATFPHEEPAPC